MVDDYLDSFQALVSNVGYMDPQTLVVKFQRCKGTPPFLPLNGMTTLWSYLSLFTSDT